MNNYFNTLKQCYIIAEIGVNYNGDMNLAREMIDAAKKAGADAVKFQTFTAESLVSAGTPKVKYQENTTSPEESHYEMIRNLEFKRDDHKCLLEYCEKVKVDFLSTPYDVDSAQFLTELGVEMFKTASADLVDIPLQQYIANTKKPSIVSVGMASLGEVEAVAHLYRKAGNPHLILLHCVSNYPCSDNSLNLNVMKTLEQAFQLPVGYSDHSIGNEAAILSIAFGANVIEKHFTTDKQLSGPDHKASSSPEEFANLVKSVRRAEGMLGNPIKHCQLEEKQMSQVSRKSIVLGQNIQAGEVFTMEHLSLKRPGTGLGSNYLQWFVGRKSSKDLMAGKLLEFVDVS
jgi:N,N'-diacetyllegionaminate synthase